MSTNEGLSAEQYEMRGSWTPEILARARAASEAVTIATLRDENQALTAEVTRLRDELATRERRLAYTSRRWSEALDERDAARAELAKKDGS